MTTLSPTPEPAAEREPITIAGTLEESTSRATEPGSDDESEGEIAPLTLEELPDPVLLATAALLDKQAQRLVIFKTSDLTPFFAWAVICTGLSNVQRDVLSKAVREELHTINVNPLSVEGTGDSGWVLMDYRGFIVHIQSPEKRGFYHLENLWGDQPHLEPSEAAVQARIAQLEAENAETAG